MPRKKLHKATLKGTIALYKKRKLPHPVSSAKTYMRGYNDVKRIRKGLKPQDRLRKINDMYKELTIENIKTFEKEQKLKFLRQQAS